MTVNFYPLLWKFGKYLEEQTIEEELFCFDQKKTKFLNRCLTEEQKNLPRTKRYLDLIQRLFIQNGAFVYPASKKKLTKKLNNTQDNTIFSLSPVWSQLFERNLSPEFSSLSEDSENVQDKEEVYFHKLSRSKPKKEKKYSKNVENSRANRTIGILGFKMMKLLKENPHTREDLALITEFSKQRVCTVLSIYKLLKLVVEDPKTNLFYWNTEQALLIPDLTKYLQDLLEAKNVKRILARKVQQLSHNLLEKIKAKKGGKTRERNIGDQINNVIKRKLGSAKSEEIKMKIEIEKNTIRDILRRLVKRKEKLLQFGQNKVKFEKLSSIKIPSSYSCNNFNYSKKKKFSTLNNKTGNKERKNKLKFKTKRNNKKNKKYFKDREFKNRRKKKFQYSQDTNSLYLKKKNQKKQLLKKKYNKKKDNKLYIKQKKKNKLKRTFSYRKIKKIIVIKNRSLNISTRPQLKHKTKKKKAKKVQKKLNYSSVTGTESDSVPDLQLNSFSDSSSVESSSYDLKTNKKKNIKKQIQRKKKPDKKENSDNQTSENDERSSDNQSLTNEEIQQLLTLDYDFNFEIENDNNEYNNGMRNGNDNDNDNGDDNYEYDLINNEYSIYYSSQIPFEIPQPTIESLNYFEKSNIQDDSNSLLLQNNLFETSINKMIPIKNLFETQSFNLVNPEYENQNSPFLPIKKQNNNNPHSSYLNYQIEWDTDNQFKD
ncbi:hypothetical protein M0812_21203 [Anaeramoeba flamelloides]|uniref:E2F/DP family winged-helix DNA-binding domain-containing protein n=1 Tax=Anaeramoeba flamelloides TaxID=1746091 RepID=A0AAV7YR56_9EUKA|nr:hypothetical protein M0812_21203 [Anaeramoeba flamelloides]